MVSQTYPSNISDLYTSINETQANGLPVGFSMPALDTNISNRTTLQLILSDLTSIRNNPTDVQTFMNNTNAMPEEGRPVFANIAETEDWLDSVITAETGILPIAISDLDSYNTHIVGIPDAPVGSAGSLGIANITRNLGIMSSMTNARQTLGPDFNSYFSSAYDPYDPCNNGLFDSLLNHGSVIDELASLLAPLVGAVLAPILGPIIEAVAALYDLIAPALALLAGMVNELLKFANATGLASLYNDPCAQGVLNQIGTPTFLDQLNIASSSNPFS